MASKSTALTVRQGVGNVGDEAAGVQPTDEHDMFGQAVAASLRQMNRLHTIKAKVEIYRVLEKFVEIEESKWGKVCYIITIQLSD